MADLERIDEANNVNHLAARGGLADRLNAAAPTPAPSPTDGRRFRKSPERLTSVSVPRELQAELRRLTLDASSEQGRRVAAWEVIAEALLGAEWLAETRLRVGD